MTVTSFKLAIVWRSDRRKRIDGSYSDMIENRQMISCPSATKFLAPLLIITISCTSIASHHFSRLRSNEVGDLVCVIDDESFDWKLIRTIDNLKGNNEDGQFFVVGKIKEIVEDPEWWVFSCVCGHPIVGDDNVFHCQLCSREVQHFMIRIKILVENGTSCGTFVLLDSAATKLLERTCSDVFLLLEDKMDRIEHRYCPQFFHKLLGKEIIFKVQAKRISTQGYCCTFKVINVISDAHFFNKLQADQCIKVPSMASCVLVDHHCQWPPFILSVKEYKVQI
ncbi:uncharacterized protein DS421_4g121670 [Arachis hypogaea]|nr:uncharacterized protein DS421_4g121670 [Arachis hypogaea]